VISDEELHEIAREDEGSDVQFQTSIMAREILACRKAFSEPVVWIDPQVIINFQCGEEIKEWAWAKKIDDTDIPLYRKPTIPS